MENVDFVKLATIVYSIIFYLIATFTLISKASIQSFYHFINTNDLLSKLI